MLLLLALLQGALVGKRRTYIDHFAPLTLVLLVAMSPRPNHWEQVIIQKRILVQLPQRQLRNMIL